MPDRERSPYQSRAGSGPNAGGQRIHHLSDGEPIGHGRTAARAWIHGGRVIIEDRFRAKVVMTWCDVSIYCDRLCLTRLVTHRRGDPSHIESSERLRSSLRQLGLGGWRNIDGKLTHITGSICRNGDAGGPCEFDTMPVRPGTLPCTSGNIRTVACRVSDYAVSGLTLELSLPSTSNMNL